MNKMNKKFLIFVSFLLLCIMTMKAGAISIPMVISGEIIIDGITYGNQEITITDQNLGNYEWTTTTLTNGRYQIVLNNLKDAQGREIYAGHIIHIDACDVNLNSACRKTITAGTDPIDLSWYDLSASDISTGAIDTNEIAWCNANVCKLVCDPCPACEVCDEPVCAEVICPIITECEPCPEDKDGIGLWIIIAEIIGAAGIASGVTYYSRKNISTVKGVTVKTRIGANGEKIVEHLHRGLRNYHDPKTTHTDLKERHPKGELYPEYQKDTTGKYVYVPEK